MQGKYQRTYGTLHMGLIRFSTDRVVCPAGFPAGRASHTTVRTGRVYSGSLRCGAIDTKSADIDW